MPRRPCESSPKNWRSSSGIWPGNAVGVLTTLEDEMLTTAGKTFLTTGANPVRLGPSLASASFTVAGGLSFPAPLPAARPSPPRLNCRAPAKTAAFELLQILRFFIRCSLSLCGHFHDLQR